MAIIPWTWGPVVLTDNGVPASIISAQGTQIVIKKASFCNFNNGMGGNDSYKIYLCRNGAAVGNNNTIIQYRVVLAGKTDNPIEFINLALGPLDVIEGNNLAAAQNFTATFSGFQFSS